MCISDDLASGGVDLGETAPSRISQLLEIANDSPASIPFLCKLTNPELTINYLLNGLLTLGAIIPQFQSPPGQGIRQEIAHYAVEPAERTQVS